MRKGAAGSGDDPKFRNRVGSTFADVTYSMLLGCNPGAFLYAENHSLGEWFKRSLLAMMEK